MPATAVTRTRKFGFLASDRFEEKVGDGWTVIGCVMGFLNVFDLMHDATPGLLAGGLFKAR